MILNDFYKLILAITFGILFSSCIEKPVYPSQPVIAYKDFVRHGDFSDPDSAELVVSFTDNEGDIGLSQADTHGIFKQGNIWMDYYYWDTIAGHWATDLPGSPQIDTFRVSFRVPPVLPAGDPDEPMKGLIYVKQVKPFKVHNKIKYVVCLYDRAMHKSDTIHTPTILF